MVLFLPIFDVFEEDFKPLTYLPTKNLLYTQQNKYGSEFDRKKQTPPPLTIFYKYFEPLPFIKPPYYYSET